MSIKHVNALGETGWQPEVNGYSLWKTQDYCGDGEWELDYSWHREKPTHFKSAKPVIYKHKLWAGVEEWWHEIAESIDRRAEKRAEKKSLRNQWIPYVERGGAVSIMQAKTEDPWEYGYLMAQADGTKDYFLRGIEGEDLTYRELAIEGWNSFFEDAGTVQDYRKID